MDRVKMTTCVAHVVHLRLGKYRRSFQPLTDMLDGLFHLLNFLHVWAVISWQARRILVSIYGMTQQMRCQGSGKNQSDLEKPVESMEQLIVQNCRPQYLVRWL